jgi:ATP synthase protein I
MNGEQKPPSLDDLNAKLRAAREHRDGAASEPNRGDEGAGETAGLGFALRIGTELVAALLVGVGIGVLLDYWLGTKPWMLIVFFVLGSAAGFLNVYRTVSGYGYAAGYRREDGGAADKAPGSDGGEHDEGSR